VTHAHRCGAGRSPRSANWITDLELASRLSFFLWSSIPDEQLISLAAQGRLSNPVGLQQQVKRMLADPRSASLVNNFAQQLLYLRNLKATSPELRRTSAESRCPGTEAGRLRERVAHTVDAVGP